MDFGEASDSFVASAFWLEKDPLKSWSDFSVALENGCNVRLIYLKIWTLCFSSL